jgi:hypothetical protein
MAISGGEVHALFELKRGAALRLFFILIGRFPALPGTEKI